MSKKVVGVLGSSAISYIDHLVPLCQILNIPLLCTDAWVYDLIELYYPTMDVELASPLDYCLDPFLKDADALAFVFHYKKCEGGYLIGDYILNSNAKSIYSLHGNSDKKRNLFWAEKTAEEDIVLLYGDFMVDFHKEKGILERVPNLIICGNYRLEYYKQNISFFQKKIFPWLFKDRAKKTMLYAPTWAGINKKSEWRVDYSSFLENVDFILGNIPPDFQMYVKIHPYQLQLFPDHCTAIQEKFSSSTVKFIDNLPLIYPLLDNVDIYLGDYSSIGYDFLYFNKPLFFLNADNRDPLQDKGVYLYQCGTTLQPQDFPHIYSIIGKFLKEKDPFTEIRQKVYHYAFADVPLEVLKKEIELML